MESSFLDASAAAAASGATPSISKPHIPLTFFDLPRATQRDILSHCSNNDLVCLSLVSKRFHGLAAEQLYRNISIIFPNKNDADIDDPVDRLARALETITTSNYNYAKHLRGISMDTLAVGVKGERAYQACLYKKSCGKLLNNLLYLVLRRAHHIETFHWNVRVELSRPVFRELHRLPRLEELRIRMQDGDSYWTIPPPLPISRHRNRAFAHNQNPQTPPPSWPHHHWYALASTSVFHHPTAPQANPGAQISWGSSSGSPPTSKDPPTLSGFKKLRSLAILDIDNPYTVKEIRTCIQKSRTTLTELKLSFCDALVARVRNPPSEANPDDTDTDSDFQLVPSHLNTNNGPNDPAKELREQEERKFHEEALARILDVQSTPLGGIKRNDPCGGKGAKGQASKDDQKRRAKVSRAESSGSTQDVSTNPRRGPRRRVFKATEMPALASQRSNASQAKGNAGPEDHGQKTPAAGSSSSAGAPRRRRCRRGKGRKRAKAAEQNKAFPEDDDVADCETTADTEDGDGDMTSQPSDLDDLRETLGQLQKAAGSLMGDFERLRLQDCSELEAEGQSAQLQARILSTELSGIKNKVRLVERETLLVERELEDTKEGIEARTTMANAAEHPVKQYARRTRGLSLESLSIQLIPVKPGVLAKAVNLNCLTQLTLLDVGDQIPIWCMMMNSNNSRPLALRSVFTDHVSHQFLKFVSELEEVHELFMLDRGPQHQPRSLAPRVETTIEQIRRTTLYTHLKTLKRLWIKDDSGDTKWDIDEKTMIAICVKGAKLQELGIGMNVNAVHAFLQFLSHLRSLRAINILHFRNGDTCMWVVQEIRRFIVDHLSHHPHMVLDWISVENGSVHQVIRTPKEKKPESHKKKGKIRWRGKDLDYSTALGWSILHPWRSLPSDMIGSGDEDDYPEGTTRLKITTQGPLRFDQAPGIKIFEKEIRCGRL